MKIYMRLSLIVIVIFFFFTTGCKKSETVYLNNYGLGMMVKDIKGVKKITVEDIVLPSGLSSTAKVYVNTVEVYNPEEWKLLNPKSSIMTKDGENYFWFKVVDKNSELIRQKNLKIQYHVQEVLPTEFVHDVKFDE